MILNALTDYYERMAVDPESGMPLPGYSETSISFALIIDQHGELKNVMDLRDSTGKKPVPCKMKVPAAIKRAVNVAPNFLWDNTGYVLCVDGKGKEERTQKTFEAFKERHQKVSEQFDNKRLKAVSEFLSQWSKKKFSELPLHEEMLDQNVVFRLKDDDVYIHEHPSVQKIWKNLQDEVEAEYTATCLVTGADAPIARLHPAIKGIMGAQSAGAAIVSFNLDAFTSYGKDQSYNAPVGERAAFAYTTALNYLLRRDNRRCLQIGDATTVFWAEKSTPSEDWISEMLDLSLEEDNPSDEVDNSVASATVRSILSALRDGKSIDEFLDEIDPDIRFFILGLSPNQSRISVRFWNTSTFGELARNVGKHYSDMAIERQYPNQSKLPQLWKLLLETAVQGKRDNIPPLLSGALTRSVLTGTRYPESLYSAVLSRIRSDKTITYLRAAIIKACLLRNHPEKAGGLLMSLDEERADVPYLLGRLFSILEKAQRDALGKTINSTIRNRYFGSASATPSVVFPQLLRLAQHHIAKAEYGESNDRKIRKVMLGITDFPPRLSLQEQGVFTIGYYHQSNANYQKKEKE